MRLLLLVNVGTPQAAKYATPSLAALYTLRFRADELDSASASKGEVPLGTLLIHMREIPKHRLVAVVPKGNSKETNEPVGGVQEGASSIDVNGVWLALASRSRMTKTRKAS